VPAVDIGEAVAERLDAIRPDARLLDRRNRAFRRFQQASLPEQRRDLPPRIGAHLLPRDARHAFMPIFPIGIGRPGCREQGEKPAEHGEEMIRHAVS